MIVWWCPRCGLRITTNEWLDEQKCRSAVPQGLYLQVCEGRLLPLISERVRGIRPDSPQDTQVRWA